MVGSTNKPASFFKIFFNEFSSMLRIPPEFVKKNGVMLPQTSLLKTESGKSWDVNFEPVGQHFYFTNGWPDFVKDNQLTEMDFLVFHLVGKSIFQVSIYGMEGCLKKPSSPVSPNSQRSGKDVELLPKLEPKEENYGSGGELSENTSFSAVVKEHKRYSMHIPKDFAKETGILGKTTIKLQNAEGKEWDVQIQVRKDDGRIRMTSGWTRFRHENELVMGSKCRFEFDAASEKLIMTKEHEITNMICAKGGRVRPCKSIVIPTKRARGRPPKSIVVPTKRRRGRPCKILVI